MSFFSEARDKLESFVEDIKKDITGAEAKVEGEFAGEGGEGSAPLPLEDKNRFKSFAPPRTANDAKWFVDGCGYMWAVSVAIEEATESIWILDWWLSPELYLRRPPSKNEEYRLDRMLLAAAERGVQVNVIVYKEVALALSCDSEHTKHALEQHPNIKVFRHPDHVPSADHVESQLASEFKNFSMNSLSHFDLAKLPKEGLSALYGMNNDVILYWAHHEKLCIIDGKMAFMGGLDLCFGRWDTNSHPIADAHPSDLENIIWPGQDFNNDRYYDFSDVKNWDQNKLDRTKYSRMGWSDLSICIQGHVLEDIRAHFVERWNFIYREKYDTRDNDKYALLELKPEDVSDGYYGLNGIATGKTIAQHTMGALDRTKAMFGGLGGFGHHRNTVTSGIPIQFVRSCCEWSNGVPTEHSIANAYIEVIRNSQHFIYIENQFFITATGDKQSPVENKIGAAITERIIRAHQEGTPYKIIVLMPAIPCFAGDLHSKESLGTRAIMEYQYNSICRGGHSIMEVLEEAGVPAMDYIRFYNLRNFDRLNDGAALNRAENDSGVNYEDARKEHDDIVGAGYNDQGEGTGARAGQHNAQYDRYQEAASHSPSDAKYDTISHCYMENGPLVSSIPWNGSAEAEIDAFVSEELYIHSKILIADDRIVICGSANLNDRSQLGTHDSEIAVVIEDPTPVESVMNGEPFTASKFAASLRRQLFRKHLGLLPHQDFTQPTENFMPINKDPNVYDFNSDSDRLVQDVFSREFTQLWNGQAATNTAVFEKVFHAVPTDLVRDWTQYEEYWSKNFASEGKDDDDKEKPSKYGWGHVVADEFSGVEEVKEQLDRVRGTLVEMSLKFMDGVDFAKEGVSFNALTDEIYT